MKELEKFHAGLTTLAWLDIGDEGVKRLTPLTQLKDLRLNNTTIKDPKCFEGLINLESLDLGDAYVLDHSLAPLAKMKNLRRLNLLGTLVTDEGLKHLSGLTELEDLDLYGVKVTDSGIEHLSKLKKLRRLNLLGAQISDASAGILSGLKELRELNLYRSRITNAGLAKLHRLRNLRTARLAVHRVLPALAWMRCVPRCRMSSVTFVDTAPPVTTSKVAPPRGSQRASDRKVGAVDGRNRPQRGQRHPLYLARADAIDRRGREVFGGRRRRSRNLTSKRPKSATLPWIRLRKSAPSGTWI